jgi:hypothetical protein
LVEAQWQLEFAVGYRRQIMRQLEQPNPGIPFLVHILMHHENFDEDLPDLSTFPVHLKFLLTAFCPETTHFGRILEDIEEQFTDNGVKLCDFASAIRRNSEGDRTSQRAISSNARKMNRTVPNSDTERSCAVECRPRCAAQRADEQQPRRMTRTHRPPR